MDNVARGVIQWMKSDTWNRALSFRQHPAYGRLTRARGASGGSLGMGPCMSQLPGFITKKARRGHQVHEEDKKDALRGAHDCLLRDLGVLALPCLLRYMKTTRCAAASMVPWARAIHPGLIQCADAVVRFTCAGRIPVIARSGAVAGLDPAEQSRARTAPRHGLADNAY